MTGQGTATEVGDSSMAVECETIPSASSLSTVIGTVVSQPQHVMIRSQSEHHQVTIKRPLKRHSDISAWTHVQNYSHIVRNLRFSSKHPQPSLSNSNATSTSHAGTWGNTLTTNTYSTINAPPISTANYYGMPKTYGSRTVTSSRRGEGSGRPNTPVSSVTDLTTDTDGEKEKWV